jgi:hypothetical protein
MGGISVKEITLQNGGFALVDDNDFAELTKHDWYKDGKYACRWEYRDNKHIKIYMHREIMKGQEVDHANRNGLDNRRENLRSCSRQQNSFNMGSKGVKTSKLKGVCFDKQTNKWKSTITLNKKQIWLGRFTDEIDAARAYDKAAKQYHGEFAYLNNV